MTRPLDSRSRALRSLRTGLALAALCASSVVASPALAGDGAASERSEAASIEDLTGFERLVAELDLLERDGRRARVAPHVFDEWLDRAGPRALPELLHELDATEALDEHRWALFSRAVDEYPAWAADQLRTGGGDALTALRRALNGLALLEARGGADDLDVLRGLALGSHDDERPERRVERAYERALAAVLSRDARAVRVLEDRWDDHAGVLWVATVKAVGGAPHQASLDLLTWLLRDAEGTQAFLVQQIGRVAERSRLPGDFALHMMLMQYAEELDAGLRRDARMTLGKLQCSEALDVLIAGLEDDDAGVREASYWALQEITGKRMKAEPVRWRAWYAAEERWWRDEFRELHQDLASEDVAVVGVAIREMGSRKLRRHELAAELVPLLEDDRAGVVKMTVAGLGALGSAVAVEPLLPLLDSDDEALRELTLRVLRSITGRDDLPAERAAWKARWSAH